jgi:anti-sigma factor RsiW
MDHVDALLPEYLAGDLDPQAKARVEAHLRTCVRCQEELRGLEQAFFALAEALPPVPPPQGTWEGIRAQLRRAHRGRDWVPVLLAAALAGAFFPRSLLGPASGESGSSPGKGGLLGQRCRGALAPP